MHACTSSRVCSVVLEQISGVCVCVCRCTQHVCAHMKQATNHPSHDAVSTGCSEAAIPLFQWDLDAFNERFNPLRHDEKALLRLNRHSQAKFLVILTDFSGDNVWHHWVSRRNHEAEAVGSLFFFAEKHRRQDSNIYLNSIKMPGGGSDGFFLWKKKQNWKYGSCKFGLLSFP